MMKQKEKELTDYDMLMACSSNTTICQMGRDVARALVRYDMSEVVNLPDLRQHAWRLYQRYLTRNPGKALEVKKIQNSSKCCKHLTTHMRDILEQEGMDAITVNRYAAHAAEITKLLFFVFFDTNYFSMIYEPIDITFQIELHRYSTKTNILLRLFAEQSEEPRVYHHILDYNNVEFLYYLDGIRLLKPDSFERGMIRATGHKITWEQLKNESITKILSQMLGKIVEVLTYD